MTLGIVAESDLSGALKSEYVFFDGERVARRDLPAGSVAYYFSDHLKTASVITDSLGNIKSESDYYPWGGELQFVANDSNHYKFTGKERDETGLDYFGARYYSNGLARFITPDWSSTPIPVPYADFGDPQSLNQYSYVRNVPTSRADVDGHCPDLCIAEAVIVTAAVSTVIATPAGQQAVKAGVQIADKVTSWLAEKGTQLSKEIAAEGMHPQILPTGGTMMSRAWNSNKDAPADPKRPGTLGKPDHQATVEEERQRVGGEKEVTIPTPNGSKGSRRADAVGTNPETGAPEIVQVYRPTPAGNVPKREVDAANDIQNATGVKPTMVPVRPLPEKKDHQ
jgi:RHS repeat-associated protein